jgi:hypothetical protein
VNAAEDLIVLARNILKVFTCAMWVGLPFSIWGSDVSYLECRYKKGDFPGSHVLGSTFYVIDMNKKTITWKYETGTTVWRIDTVTEEKVLGSLKQTMTGLVNTIEINRVTGRLQTTTWYPSGKAKDSSIPALCKKADKLF